MNLSSLPRAFASFAAIALAPLATSALAQTGTGLTGKYYDAADFTTLATTRTDPSVNFDWGAAVPTGTAITAPGSYSVAWSGQIEAAYSELYTFFLTADAGARLWVNDELIVQRTFPQGTGEMRGQIQLKAGHRVNVRVEFLPNVSSARVKLEWSSASQARQVVPTNRLYPTTEIPNGGSVMQEVWTGLSGGNLTTMTSNASYPNKPALREFLTSFECLAQDWEENYGTRVTGFIRPPVTGNYTFAVSGDEVVQLYLSTDANPANKTLVASTSTATAFRDFAANASQQSAPRALVAGQRYYVEMLHKEATGTDQWSVAWKQPGDTDFSIIPGTVLMMPNTELATPSTANYFNTLATEQPRLGCTRERFTWLRQQYQSPNPSAAKTRAQAIVSMANGDVANNTRHYGNEIPRLALAWWLTGDPVYAEKVWTNVQETMATGDFTVKWKGFTLRQIAYAYDWLYPYWDTTRRATLLNFLVTKGLNSQSNTYGNNIGILNDSGYIMAALAVGTANEGAAEPDLSQAVNQLVQKIDSWEPNGGAWFESTDYGIFAKLGLADAMQSIETSLGSSFGAGRVPGFFTARREPLTIASNSRQRFTFSDIGTGSNNVMGWANWWARRYDAPEVFDFGRQVGTSTWNALMLPETTMTPAQAGINPDTCFHGPADCVEKASMQHVATLRQNWTDPKATWVGGMGGTYMSHGMLQSGTFQLSARGVNWFVDLKSESYSVPNHGTTTPNPNGADRWDYYRNRAEGHNCLIVNPTGNPDRIWNAPPAPMIHFQSAQNGQRSFAIWDLTKNITGVTKAKRGIQLLGQRKQVLIQDEIAHPTPTTCWWFAHFSAGVSTEISSDGTSVTLTSGTERLWGKVVSGGGVWTVRDALPLPTSPAPAENASNGGYKKLAIQLSNVTNTTLAVWFVPLAPGENPPESLPTVVPLDTWNLAAQNEAPVARDGAANSVSGAPVDIDLRTLAGDDWTPLSRLVFAAGNPVGGTVEMLADGFTARFTLTPGFPGAQSFTFTATDADGTASNPATVIIGASPSTVNWTATANGSWSAAANWESSTPAASYRGGEVRFLNGITLPAGASFTITNDLAGTVQMNALSLRGSHASGSANVTITGSPLQLVPNGSLPPRIELNGPTSGFTYNVNNNIELAADTTFNGPNYGRVNFNGVISGAGGFTRTGSYTSLYFGGNNTYLGPTVIGSGSLTVGLSGNSGSLGVGDVTTNGTLTFQRANAYNVTNPIGGTGGIVQNGTGTLTLNPENTYSGSTQIYAGVLVAASLNSVNAGDPLLPSSCLGAPATVAAGTIGLASSSSSATLRYVGTGEITDRVVNLRSTAGGTIEQAGTGLLKFTSDFTATGASTKTLTLTGSTAGTGELAGAVVDNSATNKTNLTKSGNGTWVLSGNSTYTGTTTVSAGLLVVNGGIASPAALTISSGARLAGSGTISSNVTVTGTLAPGNPFGVLTTAGTMSFGSASRLAWEIGGNSATLADTLTTGALSVTSGAKIDVVLNSAGSTVNFLHSFWRTARSFPVVGAASVTGTFALGTVSTDAGGRPAATYGSFALHHTATGVNLLWTPIPGFPVIDEPTVALASPSQSVVTLANAAMNLRLAVTTTIGAGNTVAWTQVGGPGTATFADASAADTRVGFSAPGTYTLRCTVTNQVGTTATDLTVLVAQTTTLTLSEGVDDYTHQSTFVRGDNDTWNSGARDQLLIGRTNAPFRTLLSFDIPALEPGFRVESVDLSFSIAQVGSGTGTLGTLQLRRLLNTFVEGTGSGTVATSGNGTGADWTTRTGDPADPWTTAGLGTGTDYDPAVLASASGIVPATLPAGTQVSLTSNGTALADAVTNAAGAASPLGFVLTSATDTTLANHFIRFASNDHASLDWRPRLTIELSNRPAPVIDPGPAPAAAVGVLVPLSGSATNATSSTWSVVSGPGAVFLTNPASPSTTAMFTKPGTYTLRLSAANSSGETSRTLVVSATGTALTQAQVWRYSEFGTTANSGNAADSADPDGDGEVNLMEFSTGQSPLARTPAGDFLEKTATGLEFTYTRSKAAVADGMTFTVEWSDSLAAGSWSNAGVTEQILTDNGTVQTVKASLPAGSNGKRFVRLRLIQP